MKSIPAFLIFVSISYSIKGQNAMYIPPLLTGTSFNLDVQSGSRIFYGNTSTPTYGINAPYMGPTIRVNKGDSITLQVNNQLPVKTTMHWHGLHVAAMNDGGPHQIILPGKTWTPSFKIRNQAATYWYHPHGANQTEMQIGKGLAGFFIVTDSGESALNLPRSYGVDDFPLMVQTKDFDILHQLAIATDMDTAVFVNGTLNAVLDVPAQVVRFRLLNASNLRSYLFGFSDNREFYQIATDGGLKDSSLQLTRIRLSPGERVEILVNFSGMDGQNIQLKSFASELSAGIYGSAILGSGADTISGYNSNFLNGQDFEVLQIHIGSQTGTPVTTVPSALVPYQPLEISMVNSHRIIEMDTIRLLPADVPNRVEGPFALNNRVFDMDSINEVINLNATEIWTIVNHTLVAHPFHIHDVQFNVVEKGGQKPYSEETGWKDVVLVMPGDSVKLIARFETFFDAQTPYMFHCHLLHHEDDGMMGSFLVVDTLQTGISNILGRQEISIIPNPFSNFTSVVSGSDVLFQTYCYSAVGDLVYRGNGLRRLDINTTDWPAGFYFLLVKSNESVNTYKLVRY